MNKRIPYSSFVRRAKLEAHVVGSLPVPQRRKLEERCETARRRLANRHLPSRRPLLITHFGSSTSAENACTGVMIVVFFDRPDEGVTRITDLQLISPRKRLNDVAFALPLRVT